MYYRFSIVDEASGDETSFVSLGSYDDTTAISRELGEIPKDARVYHVDRYTGGMHETYGFFNEQPSYETVRKIVAGRLSEKPRR